MIQELKNILHHPEVLKEIRFLMDYGKQQPFYTNYFGVNFNSQGLVSVKLYFSYLKIPDDFIFEKYGIDQSFVTDLKKYWNPEPEKKYIHQGVTLALKCYKKNDEIKINSYVHYRCANYHLGYPDSIELTEADKLNYPGFCLENHDWGNEIKKYFYISDPITQHKILSDFDLEKKINVSDLSLIEYTESEVEKKINLITKNSAVVKNVIDSLNNDGILNLSRYFYQEHGLYYFAPGFRFNKDTIAIYYLPKSLFYELENIKTIDDLL
jgi:hypothetical protein